MATPTQPPLAGFERLGKTISLFTPPTFPSPTTTAPSLVILCTWVGGASAARIDKYTSNYRLLLPHAQILLIRATSADITIRSFAQVRASLAPARIVIRSALAAIASAQHTDALDTPPPALLHIFSHGGCHSALQLAMSLRLENEPLALPLRGIILDSCPGGNSFRKAYDALMVGLPASPVLRVLGSAVVLPVLGAVAGLQAVGLMDSIVELRRDLNDERVLGGRGIRRLYLCSRADRVVDWTDVVRHAEEAEEKGYEVETCIFERSAHCALPMEDKERYWGKVRRFWEVTEWDEKPESLERVEVSEEPLGVEGKGGDLRRPIRSKL